jgi:hypothetical protein
MLANRFTRMLVIALIVLAAFVTIGFAAISSKAAPADRSFDAVEQVRASRYSSAPALDSSYDQLESLRLGRQISHFVSASSDDQIEKLRIERLSSPAIADLVRLYWVDGKMVERLAADHSYDAIEKLRTSR